MDTPLQVDPPSTLLPGRFWIAGSPVDWAWVRRQRIEVVVDVADPGPQPDQARLAAAGVTSYRKDPLVDGAELPAAEQLSRLTATLVGAVRGGRRTLVCCSFGKNRSGLLAALALRDLLGVDGRRALDYLRARRHRAVNNATFAAHVESLAAPARPGLDLAADPAADPALVGAGGMKRA